MQYLWDKLNSNLKYITIFLDNLDCEINKLQPDEDEIDLLYMQLDCELKQMERHITKYLEDELPRYWYLKKKKPKITLTSHTIFITIPVKNSIPTPKQKKLDFWFKLKYETIFNIGDKYSTIVINTQRGDG